MEDIQNHFGLFGSVAEVIRPVDMNEKPRNFCFVIFEKEEDAELMIKEGSTKINGHEIDIRRAIPKDNKERFGGEGGDMYYGGYGSFDPYAFGYFGYGGPYVPMGYGGGHGMSGKMKGAQWGRVRGRGKRFMPY